VLENVPGTEIPIKGKLDRGFDQILIHYTTSLSICQDAVGIYKFNSDRKTLKLETIREDCTARAAQLDKEWTMKYQSPTTSVR